MFTRPKRIEQHLIFGFCPQQNLEFAIHQNVKMLTMLTLAEKYLAGTQVFDLHPVLQVIEFFDWQVAKEWDF